MSLGKTIRTYRKQKRLTQEEVAVRLGVTAPAVNKWENEVSLPDITLLAPIARLLGISLDTLLSFREELTREEIAGLTEEANRMLKEGTYEDAFRWAREKIEEYPNCDWLILNLAVILDAQRILLDLPDTEESAEYDRYFCSLYVRLLDSTEESIRLNAANLLVGFYMRKGRYDEAEKYLSYFSIQNPERKLRQAQIRAKTGKIREAYQAYEELLFSDFQQAAMVLNEMYLLASQEQDEALARILISKQGELARCFDMGSYYELSAQLQEAVADRDPDTAVRVMGDMLASVEEIGDFRSSPLYAHLKFNEMREEFRAEMKENLRKAFRDEETYGFLKDDRRWQELVKE